MHPVPYYRPSTIDGTLALIKELNNARPIAGGTDLLLRMKAGGVRPEALISLRNVEELSQLSIDGCARLGALLPLADLEHNAELMGTWPVLEQCLQTFASVQIRNAATLGGNLCNASPAADSVPNLMALDAKVQLMSVKETRMLPLEEFILGNRKTARKSDEFMTGLIIPHPGKDARGNFEKLGSFLTGMLFVINIIKDATS